MKNAETYFRNNKKNLMNLFFKKIRKNIGKFFKLDTLKFLPEIKQFFLSLQLQGFSFQNIRNFFRARLFFFELGKFAPEI